MGRPKKTPKKIRKIDTLEFDKEFVADTFGAPPAAEKLHWERAKRKRPSPKGPR